MQEKKAKKSCSACGTSPVNHKFLLISEILENFINKLEGHSFSFTKTQRWRKMADAIEKILLAITSFLHIVTFNTDKEKAITGRSKIIWEEAEKRKIPMRQIKIFNKPVELYQAKINNKTIYFQSLPIPRSLPQNGYRWLDDKFKLAEKLTENNLKAPKSFKFSSLKQALKAFSDFKKPVIIKPQNGSRGRHTTTNITNTIELEKAVKLAREISRALVMQEHLFGSVYRATVINKKLVGFFRGDSPQILGNGTQNINELILEKNKNRDTRISEILINDDLINFIQRQGYDLNDVLETNKNLNLTAKTGRMYGSYTEEMLPKIHPKIHRIFEQAGVIVNAPVVGFDLIIEDPTKDPDTQNWGIIECNSLPFIDLHYFALEGPRINLAENVWDLWNK